MTVAEAAEKLGVSPQRIRQLIAENRLRAVSVMESRGSVWSISAKALKSIRKVSLGRPKKQVA